MCIRDRSQTDSRIILDMNGAEKLLGRGDMLLMTSSMPKPMRVQGAYIPDQEMEAVTEFIKSADAAPQYDAEICLLYTSGYHPRIG